MEEGVGTILIGIKQAKRLRRNAVRVIPLYHFRKKKGGGGGKALYKCTNIAKSIHVYLLIRNLVIGKKLSSTR